MTFVSLHFSCYDTKSNVPYWKYPPKAELWQWHRKPRRRRGRRGRCQICQRLTLRPCQSQVKITALMQHTESIQHIKHSLLKPTEAVQFVSYYSHPKNQPQILNISWETESEETYLCREIERVTQSSEWSEQPHPAWSNVNQVLTSNVLLDLMIV